MTLIHVETPGLFTTVQDPGRPGYGPIGVSASGAADSVALRLGNRLVENPEGAAALEMTLLGGVFQFPEGARVSLAGSDFGATLDGSPVPLWTAFDAPPGGILRMGPTRSGARCYLCVHGGDRGEAVSWAALRRMSLAASAVSRAGPFARATCWTLARPPSPHFARGRSPPIR